MSTQASMEPLQEVLSKGWIAFSEDEGRLIAFGAAYDEVVANAEKQGVVDIVVVKVPETLVYRVNGANSEARRRQRRPSSCSQPW